MKFIFIIVALLFIGCEAKKQTAEQRNEEIARSMFDAFNKHDWKSMADHYIDSALFLDPSLGTIYVKQSHDAIIHKYQEMEMMYDDIHDEITGVYPSGDRVIVEFVSTGSATSNGDLAYLEIPIVSVLTISNGKIVKDATYYDQ